MRHAPRIPKSQSVIETDVLTPREMAERRLQSILSARQNAMRNARHIEWALDHPDEIEVKLSLWMPNVSQCISLMGRLSGEMIDRSDRAPVGEQKRRTMQGLAVLSTREVLATYAKSLRVFAESSLQSLESLYEQEAS